MKKCSTCEPNEDSHRKSIPCVLSHGLSSIPQSHAHILMENRIRYTNFLCVCFPQKRPLLIAQGDRDPRVLRSQSESIARHVDPSLLTYLLCAYSYLAVLRSYFLDRNRNPISTSPCGIVQGLKYNGHMQCNCNSLLQGLCVLLDAAAGFVTVLLGCVRFTPSEDCFFKTDGVR